MKRRGKLLAGAGRTTPLLDKVSEAIFGYCESRPVRGLLLLVIDDVTEEFAAGLPPFAGGLNGSAQSLGRHLA
jgi:hypothetical protein